MNAQVPLGTPPGTGASRVSGVAGQAANRLSRAGVSFLRWWWGELRDLLPARVRAPSDGGARDLLIQVDGRDARLWLGGGAVATPLGGLGLDAGPAGGDLAGRLPPAIGRTVLVLPPNAVLTVRQVLPAATEENLREVLGFEMDRNTPFRVEQVYYGFDIRRRDRVGQTLDVELRVVPRKVVDDWREFMAAQGVALDVVGVGTVDGGVWRGDALGRIECGRPDGGRGVAKGRTVPWLLAAVLAGLAGVAVALPLLELRDRVDLLESRVAVAKTRAVAVNRTLTEIERVRERAGLIAQRKARHPAVLAMLAEVTRLCPDHTWISRFEVVNGKLRLQGESESASSLIALIEASPMFRDVRFASPVTRNPGTAKDRFLITADIESAGAR